MIPSCVKRVEKWWKSDVIANILAIGSPRVSLIVCAKDEQASKCPWDSANKKKNLSEGKCLGYQTF